VRGKWAGSKIVVYRLATPGLPPGDIADAGDTLIYLVLGSWVELIALMVCKIV